MGFPDFFVQRRPRDRQQLRFFPLVLLFSRKLEVELDMSALIAAATLVIALIWNLSNTSVYLVLSCLFDRTNLGAFEML